jgi:hypothetical protein
LLDKEKAVEVVAKVSDDEEWKKTLEGVYTGFSQGGRYVRKWYDGKAYRYTAQPNEISLVDYPALKSATFSLVKADGVVEERHFKKVAERKDVNPESGKEKYGDVKFADEKNKKYPIDTEAHIRAAWNYINKPKNAGKYSAEDAKSIKSKVIAAWKKKIDKEGPPSAKEESKKIEAFSDEEMTKAEIDIIIPSSGDLKKWAGEEISDSITAAYCLQDIANLYRKELEEGEPDQAKALAACIENLKNFIASEIKETEEGGVMTMFDKVQEIKKIAGELTDELIKAHSKDTMTKIQGIHDHSAALGAKCNKEAADAAGDLAKVQGEKEEALKKVSGLETENAALKKKIEELEKQPQPAKGAVKDVPISKEQDSAEKERLEKESKDPMAAMRKAHSQPIIYPLQKPLS